MSLALAAGAAVYILLPKPELLNYQGYSTVIFDRNDQLLRIALALDDRYRLYTPISDIAEHFQQVTILYEDQDFYKHSGLDYGALIRAFWQTYILKERRIGASTIVMQVARLRWNIQSNTFAGKIEQIVRALQLSRHYSKPALLEAYLNLAPYGGNIEGIGAASLIYFNKPASQLSFAEAITLALVPQNPRKRNPTSVEGMLAIQAAKAALLERWFERNPQDKQMISLINLPLLVRKTSELPYLAPHFVQYLLSQQRYKYAANYLFKSNSLGQASLSTLANRQRIKGTVDIHLQTRLEDVLQAYIKQNKSRGFNNASALLLNHRTMHIEAMIGSANFNDPSIQGQVNGTLAKRSPGSTLKPFVYALALDAGLIHPMTMLKDLPKKYAGFTPENFGRGFVGPISAQDALITSRNVPAVDLQYRLIETQQLESNTQVAKPVQTFYEFLNNAGISQLRESEFYGLALALGGGEVSMLELIELYATIANLGEHKTAISSYLQNPSDNDNKQTLLSPEASFLVFNMLRKNPKPKATTSLLTAPKFDDSQKVAWKTGTSWAFRDAWAVGIAGDYVMAVWIGNFDGPGNNAFIGRTAAGPLLFRLLDIVEHSKQFNVGEYSSLPEHYQATPFNIDKLQNLRLKWVDICQSTGDLYEPQCPSKSRTLFIPGVSPIKRANIYRKIWLDEVTGLRQCNNNRLNAKQKVFAFWPTDFQTLFEKAGVFIAKPPKFAPQCKLNEIALVGNDPIINSPQAYVNYVVQDSLKYTVPIPLQAHADAETSYLYWFANGQFIASVNVVKTSGTNPLIWQALPGKYNIQVSDDLGRSASVNVNVLAVK
ncbi:MAG: penicillin-binding protein 1C [Kangiellaceae bacterium]|jgi:penicillin-binding protein 1C